MTLILWAFWLFYGSDVSSLGDPNYAVRSAAYTRLKSAGLWCVPTLLENQKTSNMERRLRIELLLERQGHIYDRLIYSILNRMSMTDADLDSIAQLMMLDPDFAEMVYAAVDQSGGFCNPSSRRWVEATPYVKKTMRGEMAYMLQITRNQLVLPPMPREMPGHGMTPVPQQIPPAIQGGGR